jgi:outer membrane receptor protein involved in Fe transport
VNLQNQRLGEDVLPRQTSQSVYAAAVQALGSRLTLSADARYSFRAFKARQPASLSTLSVTRANPFYVAPTGAASEFIGYSFANDLPNPVTAGSAETLGATFGGTLKLAGDWRSRGYLAFAQEIDELRGSGVINSFYLSEALGNVPDRPTTAYSPPRDGYFNPFGGRPGVNTPAVLSAIGSGFLNNRGKTQVSSANLQADGAIWSLPGGALRLAIGAQARRETLHRTGATFLTSAAPVASSPIDARRDVEAAYVELHLPLFGAGNARPGLRRLELSLAGRVEHYEKVGSTTNPKVGVLWEPVDGLILRSTYGTSFRAPALRELNDPALYSPTNFPLGTARIRTLLLAGGNPDLRPETATTWTAGFDIAPRRWPGLTLGATWYDIRVRNRIGSPVSTNLVFALTDPTLTSFVSRISPATNAADLARITALLSSPAVTTTNGVFPPTAFGAIVDSRYVNAAAVRVEGVDLVAAYRFDIGADRIALAANGSYMFRFEQQVTPTSANVNEVGLVNFPVRFRGRATADWTRDRLTAGVAVNYASAYHDLAGRRIDSDPTVDLQLRLAPADHGLLQKAAVTFNVRNIFDRDPPFYDNPLGYGYDPSNGDPIGRFVSLQLVRAW